MEIDQAFTTTGPKIIFTDHSGYIDIKDKLFEALPESTKREVPRSIFGHYCNALLWHQIHNVQRLTSGATDAVIAMNAMIDDRRFYARAKTDSSVS